MKSCVGSSQIIFLTRFNLLQRYRWRVDLKRPMRSLPGRWKGLQQVSGFSQATGTRCAMAAKESRRSIFICGRLSPDPAAGEAYWSLANLKTFRFDDTRLAAMRDQFGALQQPSENKFHLAFALGKAFEDREEFDESFRAYAEGNAIKRQFSAYDADKTRERVDNLIAQCDSSLLDGGGHPSREPIFILGLPRAGSTLLEQI